MPYLKKRYIADKTSFRIPPMVSSCNRTFFAVLYKYIRDTDPDLSGGGGSNISRVGPHTEIRWRVKTIFVTPNFLSFMFLFFLLCFSLSFLSRSLVGRPLQSRPLDQSFLTQTFYNKSYKGAGGRL